MVGRRRDGRCVAHGGARTSRRSRHAALGFYVGGHVGYLFGNANATFADPVPGATAGGTTPYGAFFGGLQAGYEHYFPPD